MESFENRLFDLLENQSFDQLNEDDQLFVLQHLTEKEYQSQHMLMRSSAEMDFPVVAPQPLHLPKRKNAGLLISIPLYQALMGAAAIFIGVWFIWPNDNSNITETAKSTGNRVDTVYITQLKYDTVVIHSEKTLLAKNEKQTDTVYIYEAPSPSSSRMLQPGMNQPQVILDENIIKTKGKSLKEEDVTSLLPDLPKMGL